MSATAFTVPLGSGITLKGLFEARVVHAPDKVAAVCGTQSLTFVMLNKYANRVARALRRRGVGMETVVGMHASRSLEMLIGMLGIVKAGAAYLPLDPAYPADRLAYMLQDSGVTTVLHQGGSSQGLSAVSPNGRVQLPDPAAESEEFESPDEPIHVPANSLAYVIYTSGSTGHPKGVLGTHEGMLNRLQWMWQIFPYMSGEVCCMKTSLSFLDSCCEIFGPLLAGVPVVLIGEELLHDAEQLVCELEARQVTRIVLVPSLLRVLLRVSGIRSRLRKLAFWVSSGEALTPELAQMFREVLPEARLVNLYGCSELSADCTCYEVTDPVAGTIPAGFALPNHQVYVVDGEQREAPTGTIGEVCVSGTGVARGYLGAPKLTAERFLPNPFGKPGSRIFRTGDLGRKRLDGMLELAGRADRQVKIRGHRVELGEIEAVLRAHPSIEEAAVVFSGLSAPGGRLTAYLVVSDRPLLDRLTVAEYLSCKLPAYMVPGAFEFVASLPLTPSGKVDRLALSTKEAALFRATACTPEEKILSRLFEEILDLAPADIPVGIHDEFDQLGGDSISVMDLVNRARQEGLSLTVHDVFREGTVSALAVVAARRALSSSSPLPGTSKQA